MIDKEREKQLDEVYSKAKEKGLIIIIPAGDEGNHITYEGINISEALGQIEQFKFALLQSEMWWVKKQQDEAKK